MAFALAFLHLVTVEGMVGWNGKIGMDGLMDEWMVE